MKREQVMKEIEKIGKEVETEINKGQNPHLEIPVRTLSNIEFDKDKKQLTLGERKSKRSFMNVAHTRKFMQTLMVGSFCHDLLREDLHTSLRDMYYALKRTIPGTKDNTFEEQSESDPCVIDLETMGDFLREEMHLNADVRGRVVGNVVIKDRGDTVNWAKLGSGGWSIPSNVEEIELKTVEADYIFVVEKNAAFERMHEDKFWREQNCILVTSQGQAARGVRRLVNRLSTEHNLPVIIFTDADAYGWYIYSVLKWGSMNLAHVSNRLGTPNAKYVGLTMSDINNYDLHNYTIKATEMDMKRAKELSQYPWFQKPEWQKELELMIKMKKKAELEALSSKGLKFMTKEYLPAKIERKEFLP
ncbi:MAG: DNA topoisomerase IV subunit A [Candidatus Diapherotrites archaeon]|nr:DNA topoisomerase IV subunit A [Candidatus Diapherotrites archaeon]